jgi:hypothetical protein
MSYQFKIKIETQTHFLSSYLSYWPFFLIFFCIKYFKIDPDHNGVALNEWMKYYSEKYPPNSSVDSCARCETIKSYKK